MKIHHIGYAVKNIDNSIKEFEMLGYQKYRQKVVDKERKVIIQFMKNDNYMVELVAPLEKGSPIDNIIKKAGITPYHICYETNNIEEKIKKLLNDKYVLIHKPNIAIAIENKMVAFLYGKNTGIIELIEI